MTYKYKEYQTRDITVQLPGFNEGENTLITLSVQSLSDAMGEDKEDENSEAHQIDEQIYYYIDDKDIDAGGINICQNMLDEKFNFICDGNQL